MKDKSFFRHPLIFLFLIALSFLEPSTVSADYPEIGRLQNNDVLYKQLTQDISLYYRRAAAEETLPMLQFYQYRTKEEMTLFALAAKVNLPYETIATLNRMERSRTISKETSVLLANLPGLFVPKKPKNGLEQLLNDSNRTGRYLQVTVTDSWEVGNENRSDLEAVNFQFYPGERFNKEELAYFLKIFFRVPVKKGQITSYFGNRVNPFTGLLSFHTGIDVVASRGTEVIASKSGTVSDVGFDPVYGVYVVITHDGYYQTMYGHLEKTFLELNQSVNSGMIIGTLGNSGLSTGSHLHFEIRRKGKPLDPIPLLFKGHR